MDTVSPTVVGLLESYVELLQFYKASFTNFLCTVQMTAASLVHVRSNTAATTTIAVLIVYLRPLK